MKAVGLKNYLKVSDSECFIEVDLPNPQPGDRDLLVAVKAISVNPVDTKVRRPKDKVENPPRVLGWDGSGVVVALGPKATEFKVGDEVFFAGDITRPGSNAELICVDERIVGHKPKNLTHEEAAAMPLTSLTAWEVLFERLSYSTEKNNPRNARSLLIIGGAGGVGSIAIQMAKSMAGIKSVIATASRAESVDWCKSMGADHVINHREPLRKQLQEIGLDTVDTIFCCAPTDIYFEQFRDLITPQGHIASIVETTGGAPLALSSLQGKSVTFGWGFMFTRSMFQTSDMHVQKEILDAVSKALDDGILKSTLTQNLGPLNRESLRAAHEALEAGSSIGKTVLSAIEGV